MLLISLIIFSPTGSFNKPVVFYYRPARDMIRAPNNPAQFQFDFMLYGGNSPNINSITVYNYWINPLVRTSLLTFSPTAPTGWQSSYLVRYVLIPGKKLRYLIISIAD